MKIAQQLHEIQPLSRGSALALTRVADDEIGRRRVLLPQAGSIWTGLL